MNIPSDWRTAIIDTITCLTTRISIRMEYSEETGELRRRSQGTADLRSGTWQAWRGYGVTHSGPLKYRSSAAINAMTSDNTGLTHLQDSPGSDIAVLLKSHPLFAETDLAALTKLLSCGQMLTLRP